MFAVPKSIITISGFTPETMENISAMKADTEYKKELSKSMKKKTGMDALPVMIYNRLLDYYLKHNKLREAMFIVCMANWGCRFGDAVRVRFCHLFDENGNFKESFMLNGGEEKTGKQNIYYNNSAVRKIVSMYLAENPREYYDYLFVSESRNKSRKTLREIEIEERFGDDVERIKNELKNISEKKSKILDLYSKNILTEQEIESKLKKLRLKEVEYNENLVDIEKRIENYVCNAPNISIQTPMTRAAAEVFIKSALKELNIVTENRIDKNDDINLDKKFNTHSLRKLFAEEFYRKGCELSLNGELCVDMTMLKLLQDKFMHSNNQITGRYNQIEEKAFRDICMNLNIGIDVLEKIK